LNSSTTSSPFERGGNQDVALHFQRLFSPRAAAVAGKSLQATGFRQVLPDIVHVEAAVVGHDTVVPDF
jgi:hypothetical protein